MIYRFEAPLWLYSGGGAWHFLTLPVEVGAGLKAMTGRTPGWGSIRVVVTVGETRWRTSVFPDRKSGSFLLPVKADVRRAEGLAAGDTAHVTLEIEA